MSVVQLFCMHYYYKTSLSWCTQSLFSSKESINSMILSLSKKNQSNKSNRNIIFSMILS